MKVVITGAGGFIGGRLANALLKIGQLSNQSGVPTAISQISLLDVAFPGDVDPRLKCFKGDLTDASLVSEVFGNDTDAVFHLASIVSGGAEADFDLGMKVNLDGTRALLEMARKQVTPPRFVFSSSVAAFGANLPAEIDDNTMPSPQVSYGVQKVCCEYLINDYTRKGFVDGRVLRFPTVSVRPGKPNLAKSSYVSGIIREPLNGVVARCPVSAKSSAWIISPDKVVDALIHGYNLPSSAWGVNRVVNLPGISASAGEMVDALRKIAGDKIADLVDWTVDADIQTYIDNLPARFKTDRALKMGFVADKDVESIILDYIRDQNIKI